MAYTFRNATQANAQSGNPITHNHTPGAAATVAILSIVVEGTTARTGTPNATPTIDGVAATQIEVSTSNGENLIEMWYVCKSFSGAQFAVSVPNDGTLACHLEVVTADAGTGYASVFSDGGVATALLATDDGLTVSATSTAVGDFLYARLVCGEAAVGSILEDSANPTKTTILEIDHGAYTSASAYANSDGAGTESFSWTWTNDVGAAIAVAFKSALNVNVDKAGYGAVSESRTVRLGQLVLSPLSGVQTLDAFIIDLEAPIAGDLTISMIYH